MRGSCLCSGVEFEIAESLPKIYQCHCSLCRKVTGSSANAATIVNYDQLTWSRGDDLIQTFTSETGFKSHFCSRCGSPLPNPTRDDSAWWVPVGLLEQDDQIELAAHLFTGSRAPWDTLPEAGQHFSEMPDNAILDGLLGRS